MLLKCTYGPEEPLSSRYLKTRFIVERYGALTAALDAMQGLIFAHLILLVFFCFKAVSTTAPMKRAVLPEDKSIRIATYNLRYDSMPNNITVQQTLASLPDPLVTPTYLSLEGEQPWSTRRIRVWQNLLSEGVVLFGEFRGGSLMYSWY